MSERFRGLNPTIDVAGFQAQKELDPRVVVDRQPDYFSRERFNGLFGLSRPETFYRLPEFLTALAVTGQLSEDQLDTMLGIHDTLWLSVEDTEVSQADASRRLQNLRESSQSKLPREIAGAYWKWESLAVALKRLGGVNNDIREKLNPVSNVPTINLVDIQAGFDFPLLQALIDMPQVLRTLKENYREIVGNKEAAKQLLESFPIAGVNDAIRTLGQPVIHNGHLVSRGLFFERDITEHEDPVHGWSLDHIINTSEVRVGLDNKVARVSPELREIARRMAYIQGYHPLMSYEEQMQFVRIKQGKDPHNDPFYRAIDQYVSPYKSYISVYAPAVAARSRSGIVFDRLGPSYLDAVAPPVEKAFKTSNGETIYLPKQDGGLICQCNGYPELFPGLTMQDYVRLAQEKVLIGYTTWVNSVAIPAKAYFDYFVEIAGQRPVVSKDIYSVFRETKGVGVDRYGLDENFRLQKMYELAYQAEITDYNIINADDEFKVSWWMAKEVRNRTEKEHYGETILQAYFMLPFRRDTALGELIRQCEDSGKRLRWHLIDSANLDLGVLRQYGYDEYAKFYKKRYGADQDPVIGGTVVESVLYTLNDMFKAPKLKDGKWIGGVVTSEGKRVKVTYADLLAVAGVREEVTGHYEYEEGKTILVRQLVEDPNPRKLDREVERAIRRWVNAEGQRLDDDDVLYKDMWYYNQLTRLTYDVAWAWMKRYSKREFKSAEFIQVAIESRNRGAFDPYNQTGILHPSKQVGETWRFGVHPDKNFKQTWEEFMGIVLKSPFATTPRHVEDPNNWKGKYNGETWIFGPSQLTDEEGRPLYNENGDPLVGFAVPDVSYVDPYLEKQRVFYANGMELTGNINGSTTKEDRLAQKRKTLRKGYMTLHTLLNGFPARDTIMVQHAHSRGSGTTIHDEHTVQTGELVRWPMPISRCRALIENSLNLVEHDFVRLKHIAFKEAQERIENGDARFRDLRNEAEEVWKDRALHEKVADPFDYFSYIRGLRDKDLINDDVMKEMLMRCGAYLRLKPGRKRPELFGNLAALLDVSTDLEVPNKEFETWLKNEASDISKAMARGARLGERLTPQAAGLDILWDEFKNTGADFTGDFARNYKYIGTGSIVGGGLLQLGHYAMYPYTAGPTMPIPGLGEVPLFIGVAGLGVIGTFAKTILLDRSGGYEFFERVTRRPHTSIRTSGALSVWRTIRAGELGVLVNDNKDQDAVANHAGQLVKLLDSTYGVSKS